MNKPNYEEQRALLLLHRALLACEEAGIEIKHGSPGVYVTGKHDLWAIASEDDFLAALDLKDFLPARSELKQCEASGGHNDCPNTALPGRRYCTEHFLERKHAWSN